MNDTPMQSVARQMLDPFARQLLESARLDGSEPGARDRALLALGLAPVGLLALGPTAAAAAAPGPASALAAGSKAIPWVVGKSLAIGLLGSVVTLGVLDRTLNSPPEAPAAQAPSVASAAVRAAPVTARGAPELATSGTNDEPPAGAASVPHLAQVSATKKPPDASLSPAAAQASGPSVASYGDGLLELEALARVRRALSAHESGRALALLDDFQRSFPGSRVAEEATVLRIEALRGVGRASEAQALALRFLRERPLSVYAAKVRAMSQAGDQISNQGH